MKKQLQLQSKQKQFQTKTQQKSSWQKLIEGILRPPRSNYKQTSLGIDSIDKGLGTFILKETRFERKDVTIQHHQKIITLTIYQPQYKNGWLILYLHGNSSSRLECSTVIKYLPRKYSLASFDFMGCGHNHQEDTISLGIRESQQVQSVVTFLKQAGFKVLLWGRSMGAATALKYGKAPVIVADSAFTSFKSLCKQIAYKNSPKCLPNCLISCFFPCVFCKLRSDIEEHGGYDLQDLDILSDVRRLNPQTMVIFMSGDEDTLIDQSNSEQLYENFMGLHKHLQIFKGTHNTKRPEQTLKKIMSLLEIFIIEHEEQIKDITSRTKLQQLTQS